MFPNELAPNRLRLEAKACARSSVKGQPSEIERMRDSRERVTALGEVLIAASPRSAAGPTEAALERLEQTTRKQEA
jgi:hypothetical protein